MELEKIRKGDELIILMGGELDHHSADDARERMDRMIADKGIMALTLDMHGVTFMDSAGLGVILGRYKLISARGGKMSITGANKFIERIFKMAGIYSLVTKV